MAKGARDKDKLQIKYALERISLDECQINETEEIGTALSYNFSGKVELDEKHRIIEVAIGYAFVSNSRELFRMKSLNFFKLHMQQSEGIGKAYRNQHFIKHLISISVHQLRGMQAIVLKDSKFKSYLIPLNVDIGLQKDTDPTGIKQGPKNVLL